MVGKGEWNSVNTAVFNVDHVQSKITRENECSREQYQLRILGLRSNE